ncbi:MAG TPA: hypothetical protein VN641_19435 [Urbifossiella sp.]|nr:hypothetical protein [Urbifossiella sp.]
MLTLTDRPMTDLGRDILQRAGNPFRNYFARNPDDEVCARYHVPELFAPERDLLHAIIDLYRYDPNTHSEVVPVLGNKGAGKTHLLHSIKHGAGGQWQLLVTPGVYQKDSDFLEYLLFQIIDTLLGGGKQKGIRPLEYLGEQLVRRQLGVALRDLSPEEKANLFPPAGLSRFGRVFGFGGVQAQERAERLAENLSGYSNFARTPAPLLQALAEAGLTPQKAFELVCNHAARSESHNTAGLMRRHIFNGFARAALLKDESELANFLTFGFAELEFHVRPTRQDLVLALFKVLADIFRGLKTPIVVAFDQLEDLLLARRADDAHKTAEAFFAGIVQVMHQIEGLLFLIFAERGLWNRFVPSLDGYIQDRLNNPVHVPKHGTVKTLRLEAPSPSLVRRVVEARLRPCLEELPEGETDSDIAPFVDEQVTRIAGTEPTLRDMLQQFRHLFDHVIYGPEDGQVEVQNRIAAEMVDAGRGVPDDEPQPEVQNRIAEEQEEITFKSVEIVELGEPGASATGVLAPFDAPPEPAMPVIPRPSALSHESLVELWQQEQRTARRKLEPEGALTGATRELQAGLGAFLAACLEHGVKVGPWRLQHVVAEWNYGEHPTYGAVTIAHWACKDAQPWKVGIGLFLARGAGKPKDLEIKLAVMDTQPTMVDHLILLRPEDDLVMSGKSKSMLQEAERQGKHARLEPIALDGFAQLYSFPRWLAAVRESLPEGSPLPNLADAIQDQCEKLLEQVCMPVQG